MVGFGSQVYTLSLSHIQKHSYTITFQHIHKHTSSSSIKSHPTLYVCPRPGQQTGTPQTGRSAVPEHQKLGGLYGRQWADSLQDHDAHQSPSVWLGETWKLYIPGDLLLLQLRYIKLGSNFELLEK